MDMNKPEPELFKKLKIFMEKIENKNDDISSNKKLTLNFLDLLYEIDNIQMLKKDFNLDLLLEEFLENRKLE